MPSRSLFAKRSSTDAPLGVPGLLVGATVASAIVGGIGAGLDSAPTAAAGLVGATAFAGAFAVYLIVSERRRHESAEGQLAGEARFLESLVESIGVVSDCRDASEILERTCTEARRLFGARSARVVRADGAVLEAHEFEGGLRVPLRGDDGAIGLLELRRPEPFHRGDLMRATVLADFASRAVENARLLADAREREEERARLTERLITAEQDERRRLSIFLHDGPLQSMSGIALMHDAALAAIRDGRYGDAEKVIATSLDRERDTIRTLRDLSFAIEPLVLRDRGFAAAVRALAEQVEASHGVTVSATVETGERLGEKAQVALYQLIREAVNQAVRRRPGRISVTVTADGERFTTEIEDDGMGERRRGGIEELDERVRVLNGHVAVEARPEGGTIVRVVLPAYAGLAGSSAGEADGASGAARDSDGASAAAGDSDGAPGTAAG
jgi:signal transduction histidine kinase